MTTRDIDSNRGIGRPVPEVLAAFALVTLVTAVLSHLPSGILHDNVHGIVAVLFLFVPQIILRRRGDIERYGFRLAPVGLGLTIALVAIVGILPLFSLGMLALFRWLCTAWPTVVAGLSCVHLRAPTWRLPDHALLLVLSQLVVVALPEELFFRGFVQGRLEEWWPPRHRLWGAPVGRAWVVGALLFGLGHYLVSFDPQMLSRAVPGLVFGWMFARTRSIFAGTLFHAACNLTMEWLATSYF